MSFGIMSHSALCRLALCRIRDYVVRYYVVRHYVAFGIMSFGIMSHSALCCIRPYVVRLCVVRRIVARPNVVRRNVVRPTVGVSVQSVSLSPFHYRIEKYYFISDNIFFANQSESQLLQRATVQYICRTFTGKSIRLYCTVMVPQLLEHVMQSTSVLIAKD